VAAFDGFDGAVRIGGPYERLGRLVVVGDEAVNGGLEVDSREDAALEATVAEPCEELFYGVEPGTGGRHELEGEAGIAGEPGAHFGGCLWAA